MRGLKMKKLITFTLCLLLCFASFGLTACGSNKTEKVDTSIATIGNGGTVVTRGDYVYFVNGYTSYETFTKNNLDRDFSVGGLYRAKLNESGQVYYTENGSVEGAERISSRLTGFESTSLYVFGNYIYYTTPVTEVTKSGKLKTDRIEFRRVKLGGGKSQKIYQSKVAASDVKFEYYYADGSVYLLVKENTTLKRINAFGKFKVSTVAKDVTSLAMKRDADNVFESDSYKNIYYTKNNDDNQVVIYNYNIAANKTEYKKTTDYKTCELIDYQFDHLYYKASREAYPSYTYFYRMDATQNAITSLAEEKLTQDSSYTTLYFLDNETSGYIVQNDSKTYYLTYNAGGECEATPITDTKIEIMAIKNNNVYFKDGSAIKYINCYEFKVSGDKTQHTIIEGDDIATHAYDIDAHNLYVYATKGSHTYLYSINVGNMIEGEEVQKQLLGVYNTSDIEENEEA